ncbi:MAG TPA: redoxin family protein [Pirellulales bacterium]|nr:redoxin family protein [Pirellulales bacterium]
MRSSISRTYTVAICAAAFGFGSFALAAEKESKTAKGNSRYDVPDGTPEELLAFIQKLRTTQPPGTTRKTRMEHMRKTCDAIVTAAERIREAKADDETTVTALKVEVEALSMLKRLSEAGSVENRDAVEKLDALTESLQKDKRPAIVNLLKLQALTQKMEKLDATDPKAVVAFAADVKAYASTAELDVQLVGMIQLATVRLYESGKQDEASAFGRELTEKVAQSESPEVQMASAQLASRIVGQILETQGQAKEAAKFYREVSERLAKSEYEPVRQAAEQLEASARKAELVGQPMPISGKLVDGGNFDSAQYKGKVVLVDFWATWCGPCKAELPNVKEVYEKYHDRGFEVVGISLDEESDTLTKFIKEEHLPWPILFEGGEETSGWNHPLAKKYGVTAIPMAVLIDRQGKVVTLSARGERLATMVEELLGSQSNSTGKSGAEKKKSG